MSGTCLMRALVFEGPHRLILREVPRPDPQAGEVLIRVHWAAICGTDLRILSGRKTRDVRVGHPVGHECAGTVAAVGPGVNGLAPEDRVAVCVVVSCGRCRYCLTDRENLCDTRITLGYHTDGAFADYMLIPAHAVRRGNVFKLPDSVPTDVATLLEPTACCLNGQHEMGLGLAESPESGAGPQSLVVFGAGPIGLLHLMLARRGRDPSPEGGALDGQPTGLADGSATVISGAGSRSAPPRVPIGPVAVVEPVPHRRAVAAQLGADDVYSPDEFDAADRFDAAILAVGAGQMVGAALKAVRKCGKVSLFAGFDRDTAVTIDPNAVHYKQLHVTGASESRRRDYAEALGLVAAGRLDPSVLITHRFPLEDYEAAFHLAVGGAALKIVLDMHAPPPAAG